MTDLGEERRIENRNIVDLCALCFGMALCFFLMYFVGMSIYNDVQWDISESIWGHVWLFFGFFVLVILSGFGFFAILFKVKQLV